MRCQFYARQDAMRANLASLYGRASRSDKALGRAWYPKACAIVAEWSEHYGVSRDTVACIIAAISPQCEWSRNLIIADDILAQRAISVGGALHINIAKARKILDNRLYDCDALGSAGARMRHYFPHGPKVNNFAQNLAGNSDVVTIDGHACQAALNDATARYALPWLPYSVFAGVYIDTAIRFSQSPADFQAIVWHTWKALYPRQTKNHVARLER